jgi:dimethylhistidine N-methyltransferase
MSGRAGEVTVLDLAPAAGDFRSDVINGLSQKPATLPCKYFYDERGSELFSRICELPEYYITRTELRILTDNAREIAATVGPGIGLVGFGTGAGTKTRLLLEQLQEPVAYVPVDISKEQLLNSCAAFSRQFPSLEVLPVCADYLQPLVLPEPVRPPERVIVYFPGSTIGNFEPDLAGEFLKRLRNVAGNGGGLLIGVDLKKDKHIIERAYNDSAGVTAAFNLNLLVRANRELGADFDISQWRHQAVYNPNDGRIEMYLISQRSQAVRIRDEPFQFAEGEKITTEFSYKYSRDELVALAKAAKFEFQRVWTDDAQLFGLFFFAAL